MIKHSDLGFSLIEMVIVISLIAAGYSIVLPTLNLGGGSDGINSVNRLAADIRSAFDLSVLANHNFRLKIFFNGSYHLERAPDGALASFPQKKEVSAEEEEEQIEQLKELFIDYKKMVMDPVEDPETEEKIAWKTPVLMAEKKLIPREWTKVTKGEWGTAHSLDSSLAIQKIFVEHREEAISLEDQDPDTPVIIYFTPSQIENASIEIGYKSKSNKEVYTLIIQPYMGYARVSDQPNDNTI